MDRIKNETDIDTALGDIQRQLSRAAWALRGLATNSPDAEAVQELAGSLDENIERMKTLSEALCHKCLTTEVIVTFSIKQNQRRKNK